VEKVKGGRCRAIIINSGNANAGTGPQGLQDAKTMADLLAQQGSWPSSEVQVSSTGAIGALLPMDKIKAAIPKLLKEAQEKNIHLAADAIRTTDTFPKIHGQTFQIAGKTCTLMGIAKGSGMIAPNMATMLAYLCTDAHIPARVLQKALAKANENTFNCISVDGETSTNDTLMILANGAASNDPIQEASPEYEHFVKVLSQTCDFLARQIVRDGEGTSKFIELKVSGIENAGNLKVLAMAMANSYLVRTAFHGEDANWGRLLSAAGACASRLGIQIDFDQVGIQFNDQRVFEKGVPLGKEAEEKAQAFMKNDEFECSVSFGPHLNTIKIYTGDLSAEYVRINAEYRT